MASGARVRVYNANGKNGIDNSEIAVLAGDLRVANIRAEQKTRAVVKKGAVNIKAEARQIIASARDPKTTIPQYPYTIDFDVSNGGLQADIGPDKSDGGQADLGNLLEYGGMFNAPIPHLQPAIDHEAPRFQENLKTIAGDIL